MQFKKEEIANLWSNGKTLTVNGKEYTVHKMSYGDYFLEPVTWRGGETDGFAPNTIWLEVVEKQPSLLQTERT